MNVGEIYMYGGSVLPYGFLLCDGHAVSRTTYSDLFNIIGTIYGNGDDTTTFNLPNLSGRVVIGSSLEYAIGYSSGEESHTLTSSELPSHSHVIPSHGHSHDITATTPSLSHSITQPAFTYAAPSGQSRSISGSNGWKGTTSTNATRSANLAISNHSASSCTKTGSVTDCAAFNTDLAGSNMPHNNMQPYLSIHYIIYSGVSI